MDTKSVTSAAVNPATFHLDCVDHLCCLEALLGPIRDEAGQGPSIAKLDAANQILAEVSEFAEPRFSAGSYGGLAERIHGMYQQSQAIEKLFSNASWTSVKRLFGQRSQDNSNIELLNAYQNLHKELNHFLVEYFVICVKRFTTDSDEKQVFLESVDALISEIDRIWN